LNLKLKFKRKLIFLITIIFIISLIFPLNGANKIEQNNMNKNKFFTESINNTLPDLTFLDLRAWWGRTNTTGLFVDFDVINMGNTYYSNEPIISNLTFLINDNNSLFGYINQTPLFYPSIWYEREILGGCNFFEMKKKPEKITVKIDFTNLIKESNENNNNKTISVLNGITISGKIYENNSGEIQLIKNIIEFNGYDNHSLSTFGYRHFLSDENGSYNISICPIEPLNNPIVYHIMARNTENNIIIINETKPLSEGDNTTIDILFSGSPPEKPNKPFGSKIGRTNRTYLFFTSGTDLDDDNVSYKFDWGDGEFSEWLGPFKSNEVVVANHSWNQTESYTIKVMSRDTKGMISKWSNPLTVNIPKKQDYCNIIYYIFNNLINQKIINKL